MGWLFRFLFKYPLLVFQQGDFRFAVSRPVAIALVVAALVALGALVSYRGLAADRSRAQRGVLIALRTGLVAILLLCLLRPTLVLKSAVPQQNFLGVLLDDSRSMTITDSEGLARADFVQQQLARADSPLLSALSQRFVLRFFRFSSSAGRIEGPGGLKYDGTASRLGPALERARDDLSGLPLAGLVMISDGADTSDQSLDAPLASLKARSIPVFTVGVGRDRFDHDIQVTRVEAPHSTLKGTSLSVDVVVTQTGYRGESVPLQVEDEGHIVSKQTVVMPPDGQSTTVRVTFTATEKGPRLFHFKIPQQAGEQVAENNTRDALVEVSDQREKVFYMEGEPRFEAKFVRRAVEDDKQLQVVILQRTAEDKYLRLDVGSPDELVGGFPKTREELFSYRAVILGSVEAASFTPDQLRMLADFVSKRGGGLLMLGGRRSFAEGGWGGTPVAEVLPVELDAGPRGPSAAENFSLLSVHPTHAGAIYPVTQLADTEKASLARWDNMPEVSTVNPVSLVKPGATVLLTGSTEQRQDQVVLAYQRYGRGKALAFPVQDSWIWKMDAKVPVEDTTHATFWRRLVRWLVDGVPDPVSVTSSDRVEPGEPLKLTAGVVDSGFVEVNDARVIAAVKTPSGKELEVPLEWTVAKDGEYQGSFTPDESGMYEIKTVATRGDKTLGTSVVHARASAGDAEYFDAAMRAPLLKRIAEETGGRFFTPSEASLLPEAISYSGRGVTLVEDKDLWDMPALFLLMLILVGAEWGVRRRWGLA